jgi:hypothetical protein
MRKKILDVLLLVLALGGLAYGAYTAGRLVTRESNDLASKSSGETRPASTSSSSTSGGKSRLKDRNVRIGVAVIAALVLWILLASLVGRIRRRHRRREWRLPR